MNTGLKLLARDGAVRIMFHPQLTTEQYAEVLELVECAETKEDLEVMVESAADAWGIKVTVEDLS